jgi:hypothetical protein
MGTLGRDSFNRGVRFEASADEIRQFGQAGLPRHPSIYSELWFGPIE